MQLPYDAVLVLAYAQECDDRVRAALAVKAIPDTSITANRPPPHPRTYAVTDCAPPDLLNRYVCWLRDAYLSAAETKLNPRIQLGSLRIFAMFSRAVLTFFGVLGG